MAKQVTWSRTPLRVVESIILLLLVPVLFCAGAVAVVWLGASIGLSDGALVLLLFAYGIAYGCLVHRFV